MAHLLHYTGPMWHNTHTYHTIAPTCITHTHSRLTNLKIHDDAHFCAITPTMEPLSSATPPSAKRSMSMRKMVNLTGKISTSYKTLVPPSACEPPKLRLSRSNTMPNLSAPSSGISSTKTTSSQNPLRTMCNKARAWLHVLTRTKKQTVSDITLDDNKGISPKEIVVQTSLDDSLDTLQDCHSERALLYARCLYEKKTMAEVQKELMENRHRSVGLFPNFLLYTLDLLWSCVFRAWWMNMRRVCHFWLSQFRAFDIFQRR